MASFDTLKALPSPLIQTLTQLGFSVMSEIQEQAIPPILEGKDILAQSKTGSGKTLAFGIPTIIDTDTNNFKPQTLIITPTRELAEQIATSLRAIATYKPNLKILTLYGGVPLRTQALSLEKGAHILVGTPGRIQDHLGKETLSLETIQKVVLDEADRMLDMGFYDDIIKINSHIKTDKQTLLFSATYPQSIEKLAKTLLKEPMSIKVDTVIQTDKIETFYYQTSHKFKTLLTLIQSYKPHSLLIFCNTKVQVISLTEQLQQKGYCTIDIHGDLEQRDRNESVIVFSNGSKTIMVATDVASRGLDIKDVAMVINYDLPFEKEVYTHRIGRTGRADASGIAISLKTNEPNQKCDYIIHHAQEAKVEDLRVDSTFRMDCEYDTLCINGGKKNKLRAGDILGTLCKEVGIDNSLIGKITITDTKSYIALHHSVTNKVVQSLKKVKIKKRKYIAWIVD